MRPLVSSGAFGNLSIAVLVNIGKSAVAARISSVEASCAGSAPTPPTLQSRQHCVEGRQHKHLRPDEGAFDHTEHATLPGPPPDRGGSGEATVNREPISFLLRSGAWDAWNGNMYRSTGFAEKKMHLWSPERPPRSSSTAVC